MKLNVSKMIFLSMISLSTLISFNVNNWFTMWILMELTLFMYIPLMSKNKINDQSMKYFIIQSFSSYLFLFSIMSESMDSWSMNFILMMTSLLIKIGMAPFHLWKPEIMGKLSWNECIMLTTLIKITPMILINKMISLKMMITPMIISLLISSATGINQLNLKKMMAYSSIFNLSWMSSAFLISKKISLTFILIYFMLNIKIMKFFEKNNLNYKNQLMFMPMKFKMIKTLLFLSISGLPPLTGFYPKLMVMNELLKTSIILPLFMILTSLLSIYMYIQTNMFSFSNFFLKKKMNKMFIKMKFSWINMLIFPLLMIMWTN